MPNSTSAALLPRAFATAEKTGPGRTPRAPETLLVVDDTEGNRYYVARVLKAAGYQVLEAENGQDGLRLLAEHRPDLVLLDIKLPDLLGWEVCRRIKEDPQTALTPVLHVSASYTTETDRARGLEGGADGYLVHPIDPAVLLATVRALLRLRRAHEELRESEQRLQQVVSHAPVALFTVDAQGTYTFFSAGSALRTHGVAPESMIGRSIDELHAEDAQFLADAKRALAGESVLDEVPLFGRLHEIRYTPLDTGGFVGVATDVTERRLAETSREEMLAIVAHDLRTPIAGVRLNLDVLDHVLKSGAQGKVSAPDVIARIRQSTQRAERLIADVLDRAQIESGTFRIESCSLDAVRVVREAVETMFPLAREQGVRLLLEAPSESCSFSGDGSRVLQALCNLIDNAIKFSPREAGAVHVKLSVAPRELTFCVQDNGPGLSDAETARVFDRYWRGPKERRAGAGLGLAIARGIVEAHGGRIWAESRPGAGARFCFVLPRPLSLT